MRFKYNKNLIISQTKDGTEDFAFEIKKIRLDDKLLIFFDVRNEMLDTGNIFFRIS